MFAIGLMTLALAALLAYLALAGLLAADKAEVPRVLGVCAAHPGRLGARVQRLGAGLGMGDPPGHLEDAARHRLGAGDIADRDHRLRELTPSTPATLGRDRNGPARPA